MSEQKTAYQSSQQPGDRRSAPSAERDREIMRALIHYRASALRELAKH